MRLAARLGRLERLAVAPRAGVCDRCGLPPPPGEPEVRIVFGNQPEPQRPRVPGCCACPPRVANIEFDRRG